MDRIDYNPTLCHLIAATVACCAACAGGVDVMQAASSTGAATTSSASSSAGSTSGGGACPGGSVDFTVDNGPQMHLASSCPPQDNWNPTSSPGPVGYFQPIGTPSGRSLAIVGCQSTMSDDDRLELDIEKDVNSQVTGPGTFACPARYTDPMGVAYTEGQSGSTQCVLIKLGPVGDSIEGTFSGRVLGSQWTWLTVAGSFRVCHAPDSL